VHIPLVCFGIAFPILVLFVEWLGVRTGDPLYRTCAQVVARDDRFDLSRVTAAGAVAAVIAGWAFAQKSVPAADVPDGGRGGFAARDAHLDHRLRVGIAAAVFTAGALLNVFCETAWQRGIAVAMLLSGVAGGFALLAVPPEAPPDEHGEQRH
jgi:hypothetical protein